MTLVILVLVILALIPLARAGAESIAGCVVWLFLAGLVIALIMDLLG